MSGKSNSEHEVEVFRRESTKAPGLGDPAYEWTETVYLNLILQQLEYTLTCAICTKLADDKQEVIIHKKISQQVYASPSRHNMEKKGKSAELCFPNIFFTVDNFDEVWDDLYLNNGELVCVEILATDKSKLFNCVLFLGSVNHTALTNVYTKRIKNSNKWAQVMSFGLMRHTNTLEFVRMKGPNNKGYAEMAIQRSSFVSESTSSTNINQCTISENGETVLVSQVDKLPLSKSDTSISNASKKLNNNDVNETAAGSNINAHSSTEHIRPLIPESTLKTHLTYVTLPWHKIILDVLRTFEKPSSSKKSVLTRKMFMHKK